VKIYFFTQQFTFINLLLAVKGAKVIYKLINNHRKLEFILKITEIGK